MLNELDGELGAALAQERIYFAFEEPTWVLDAGERPRLIKYFPGATVAPLFAARSSRRPGRFG
jgi:hypothetical protein